MEKYVHHDKSFLLLIIAYGMELIDRNQEKHILNIATIYLSVEMDFLCLGGKNCDYNFLDLLPRKEMRCVFCAYCT